MADNKKSVNLLPEYLRSNKNAKFLAGTIDQLIQSPQLERIDGFVGTKITPNYNPFTDVYIKEDLPLRKNYQLEPALVFRNESSEITDVVSYDDLINELTIQGAKTDNLDKLFQSNFYSYDPLIDWDKLVNYSQYYWLPTGPEAILVDNTDINIDIDIIGQSEYLMINGYPFSNGMKVVFEISSDSIIAGREYIVEGVGNSIQLVAFDKLEVSEKLAKAYNETFDSDAFDDFPFDGDRKLPITPEYVTINRASKDLNPWSRYNRWVHKSVLDVTATINGTQVGNYTVGTKAERPIIEFKPNLQLYNFGKTGIENVDVIDTDTTNAMSFVQGTYGYYVDGVLLEEGQRVIFNADDDETVRSTIYRVRYTLGTSPTLILDEVGTATDTDSVSVNKGAQYLGTSWYFDGSTKTWKLAQQHTVLNEAPLFELFDATGASYSLSDPINDFEGSKIFGYDIGTGTADSVLGFPLKYENSVGVGSYLFKNYFMTDTITVTVDNISSKKTTGVGYLRINNTDGTESLVNVWKTAEAYQIPVIELQTVSEATSTLTLQSLNRPVSQNTDVIAYVNGLKVLTTTTLDQFATVTFETALKENDAVRFVITTDQVPNENGYYETPLSLTNNPLNGPISTMTLSELSDHLSTMVSKLSALDGVFPGESNLRDFDNYAIYGTRFVVNANPIAFAKLFLGKKEHNLVDATRFVSDQYNQFKMNLLTSVQSIAEGSLPADALDTVLKAINRNKDNKSPYYRSDMIAYGSDKTVTSYTVPAVVNREFPIGITYNSTELSFKSVLVYVNDTQLVLNQDYTIDNIDETVVISSALVLGDVVKICTYGDTLGSFVPPTPSKLGLYPKFAPELFVDDSYASGPVTMIRGHDGSIMKAYGDYRDAIVLEYEKRVYNNIKVTYNSNIFDIASVIPGAFRNNRYSLKTANDILRKDYMKWAGVYNVDVINNTTFDDQDPFTWNFRGTYDVLFTNPVRGTWRALFNYFYDTDRPHTHPWEMLGFSEEPTWWVSTYGPAPYTSANTAMWTDLRYGYVSGTGETKSAYARPLLLNIIPVDSSGNLRSPDEFLVSPSNYGDKMAPWVFGDCSPAETAWRRSSYWPFAVSVLAALLDPCKYASTMYDLSRTSFNGSGQLVYAGDLYLNPKKIIIDDTVQIAGYGVFVAEKGKQKDLNYVTKFAKDLNYLNFNLFHKLGGFASKDKLQIVIDSVDPASLGASAILPPEDYSLILNSSNPIRSVSISGIIVQKSNGNFIVKGYDKSKPYFEILKPIKGNGGVTVGGVSAPFTDWTSPSTAGATGLGSTELVTAQTTTSRYYKQGQIVRYNNRYYRVKTGHNAQTSFDPTLFQQMSGLPMTGGVTVQVPSTYEKVVTEVPYGTEYTTIQEVYDLILGYGAFLQTQGFIFDEYSTTLFEVLDWKFTGKEFLYWTTQNWADNSLITLSPFANKLKYQYTNSIVDNILGTNYDYSLLKADGKSFPVGKFNLTRDDSVCTIDTQDTEEGIFFATLNSIQKEHAMVFNNTTIFNDTIYDIETGYKQSRIKLSGFRTANWNGDLYSPGFMNDAVKVSDWASYEIYLPSDVVRYNGSYYSAIEKVSGDQTFDFTKWVKLPEKPTQELIPNFDYKINQFEDFYSLDIDNFDAGQQQMSQHLLGYTQRPYLTNIFTNPTTQYKFYQGFIKEKGTKNAIDKISKAGSFTRKGSIDFKEEWAFRVGHFGGFESFKEIEFALEESNALENPYLIKFTSGPVSNPNSLINYTSSTNMLIAPEGYVPSATFEVYPGTYDDTNIKLTTAGYVRLDDVTATAYNKNSLLDIANNGQIKENDTIWLGFMEDGDWTVYRYSRQTAKVSGVFISAPAESITFTTNLHHGLQIGDIVSVVNFNGQVDGIYVVQDIPELNQFTVASELTTIVNETLLAYGALFKFDEVRYSNFYELSTKKDLLKLSPGEKIWVDNADQRWAVYEKLKNYNTGIGFNTPSLPPGQQLGHTIFTSDDSAIVLVSAPSWDIATYNSVGRIWVLEKNGQLLEKLYEYILNSGNKFYCDPNTATSFGYALTYDTPKELYIVGAPEASNIRASGSTTVVYSTGTGTAKGFLSEGIVKISSRNPLFDDEVTERVLVSPNDATAVGQSFEGARFGHSIYINSVAASDATTLLISAPCDGILNQGTGTVYAYSLTTATSAPLVDIVAHSAGIRVNSSSTISLTAGSRWGHKIAGDTAGNYIAISAPGFISGSQTGVVQVYNGDLEWQQAIYSPFGTTAAFGEDVTVSSSGKYLIVSSTETKVTGEAFGKVAIYTIGTSGLYELNQVIDNPTASNDLKFGHSISISDDESVLVVSSLGKNRSKFVSLDVGTKFGETTFDQSTTRFVAPIEDSGAVYVFNNLGGYFVQAEELIDAAIIEGSRYGTSVIATNDSVYVGAPWEAETSAVDNSTFFQFNKIDTDTNSWNLLRIQPDLVEVDTVKRITLINSVKEEIIEYLDIIDPLKGKITGIAEQELKYKAAFDPAIYSIGLAGTVNDTETNWIDDHVGELWWDLSTAKYVWYEQGDDTARKNNWGKLFPGSTIDVYEWVKTDLMPSEWAAQADTNEGLTNGISGQPKYPDNSVISVKQVYNNVTNSFENVYFYWVKNKVTLPEAKNRRISSYQVASLIEDPAANGVKFAEIISSDAIALANVQPMLVGNYINANITIDVINNSVPRHTEWLLLEEGKDTSVPNTLLTKKLFDSLLGHDPQGISVPDPTLSYRSKYGIGIRPQQTLFKDRLEALRNLVEFTNSVLIQNKITGNYSFENLNKLENIPDEFSREYDAIVEDTDELSLVDTVDFEHAQLQCYAVNGKITSVVVLRPGRGYTNAPGVTIKSSTGLDAEILTEINSFGSVIAATVLNPGYNYTEESPTVVVRPHTIIVRANTDYGNRWTKHAFDYSNNDWIRVKTQVYNTPLYWDYVDWIKDTYDGYKDYKYVITDTYELSKIIDTVPGDYVKIKNIGDGRYVILEKVTDSEVGDFSTSYNIVYSERGTIQILDSIWDYNNGDFAYDVATMEETLYDQVPDLELFYILTALKDNIFVKDLKVNWNLFFFTAVKYALTEQKLLDWAFKTSFINVSNQVGELDQRPVYRLDNEKYFEDYIKEVKPYRTKIRTYTSKYTGFDSGSIYTTDFDLPSYYNQETGQFESVQLGNELLDQYPWKAWHDNYKMYVKSIEMGNKGAGYTQQPTVVITTATGDTGFGAAATAYIRNGEVFSVLVTDPGQGYVTPPLVTIVGGGAVTTTATVSVVMANDEVRKNSIGMKFDRVGTVSEIANTRVDYTFPACSGYDNKFVLPWLAEPNKSNIVPLLDGKLVLSADYTIEYYTETNNNYTKKYSRFVFLNYVPEAGQIFKISYNKNINLYTAVDRIDNYYDPTDSMPGISLPLLMSGAEFGGTQIQGLPFSYSLPWGQGTYDDNSAWADLVGYYASAKLVSDVSFGTTTLVLSTTTGIVPGQRINISNTSTRYLRTDTVVVSVNPSANSITVSNKSYQIQRVAASGSTTLDPIVFHVVGEFNSYIQPGDKAEISGIGSGYDGSFVITEVNTDKFVAVSAGGPTAITKKTIKSLSNSATVYIPSVIGSIDVSSMYSVYHTEDSITNVNYFNTYLEYKVPLDVNSIADVRIYSSTYGDFLPLEGTVGDVERYYTTSTSGTFIINILNKGITDYNIDVYGYPSIEFWKDDFRFSELDTELSAGSWNSAGEFVGALGVNPTDLVVNGSSFLDPQLGYAPEEHVKGNTLDSLSMNVYTQDIQSSALSINGTFDVYPDRPTVVEIGLPLEEAVGIIVDFDGRLMHRLTQPVDPDKTGPQYSIINGVPKGVFQNPVYPEPEYDEDAEQYISSNTVNGPYQLGFEWNMFGSKHTEVYISPFGALTFGGPGTGVSARYDAGSTTTNQFAAIYMQLTRLWHNYGPDGQQLTTNNNPGIFHTTGTTGDYKWWSMTFAGSHYDVKDTIPKIPAIEFNVTLYTNGKHQYVEMKYLAPWTYPFVMGIASPFAQRFIPPDSLPGTNTSHIFYSSAITGEWYYSGLGGFDAFKAPYTFTATDQYFVVGDTLYLAPQQTPGKGGYSLLTMGGDYILDTNMVTITNQTSTIVTSLASINDVRSVYVTVNGVPVDEAEAAEDFGYILTTSGRNNQRAAVKVINLPLGDHTIQAWFLKVRDPDFSTMYEENFVVEEATNTFTLTKIPALIEPVSSQVLVEVGVNGDNRNRKRLTPPWVSYYKIENDQVTFLIDNSIPAKPIGVFNSSNVRVFGNGTLLRPGFDYTLNPPSGTITLTANVLKNGDVLAIEGLTGHDFVISGNILQLTNSIFFTNLKVTTFSNHDNLLIRTDRFDGTQTRRYVLDLPAINSNYMWVYVNGAPLTAGRDFELLEDYVTVQLNEYVVTKPGDDVLITTINDPKSTNTIVGYRMFKDIFDRVNYTRLAESNGTRLSKELMFDDTEIHVDDATKLIPPNPYRNIPGVIFVDSERIEFFEQRDNILTNLRRSTLGTAPALYSDIGTKVLDQSPQQYILSEDVVYKQKGLTTNTTTYFISTLTAEYSVGSTAAIALGTGAKTFTVNKYESVESVDVTVPTISTQTVEVVFSEPDLLTGRTATGRALITNTATTGVKLIDAGEGYLTAPDIVFISSAGTTGTGIATLTDSDSYKFKPGWRVRVSNPTGAYFEGELTSVSGSSFTVQSDTVIGTGTFSDWTVEPINVLYGDGITSLSTDTSLISNGTTSTTFATNQVFVRYGGRLLRKNNTVIHDATISYDSTSSSLINLDSEFSVVYNGTLGLHELRLNISDFETGVRIDLDHKTGKVWQSVNESILDADTIQAKFLRDRPAALPDMYYYGGDPVLTDQANFELTDDNDNPLKGY